MSNSPTHNNVRILTTFFYCCSYLFLAITMTNGQATLQYRWLMMMGQAVRPGAILLLESLKLYVGKKFCTCRPTLIYSNKICFFRYCQRCDRYITVRSGSFFAKHRRLPLGKYIRIMYTWCKQKTGASIPFKEGTIYYLQEHQFNISL